MTEIISNVNEWVILLGGLLSLIGTACGAFFAIKNWIAALKTKQGAELWTLIMEIADNAMKEAEASQASGEDKKSMVINAVKAGAEASGLDISAFLTQLDLYIDQTIDFVNKMNGAKN
jgi:hypothetical protein